MLQTEDRDLVFCADGRADSPGHSAKRGPYSMIELEVNCVIDVQLAQSNECGRRYHMEKEGLSQSIVFTGCGPDHENPRHRPPSTNCSLAG